MSHISLYSAEAAVTLPDTNNTTVSDSLVPSVNTTVAVNGGDTTAPVRNTETTVLLVAIPTAVGGFFLIFVSHLESRLVWMDVFWSELYKCYV